VGGTSHAWDVPDQRWVLHTTLFMLADAPAFIDVQASAHERFDSRLLMTRVVGGARREPHWLVADDDVRDYVSYRAAAVTRGRSLAVLARHLSANPPSLVHAHYGPVAVTMPRFAHRLGAPLFASFYGYDISMRSFVEDRRWRAKYARLFAEVAGVFAEGPALAAKVEALGCPPEKVHVIRLPANEVELAECRRVVPEDFVVTAAGRFVEKKGFDTAIRAFARALRGRSDARLVLMGGGELEPQLRQLVRDEGITEQVTWHAFLPFAEFTSRAAAGSVAVFPSRSAANGDSEGGAPVTLVELQWLGMPAIVSDHDDLPFAAAPELPVVPANDVDAWAEVLRSFYEQRSELEALGRAAMRFVREHNSVAENVRAREAVYGAALAGAHHGFRPTAKR
jgi:colanic acid/amylovoran/stewartan biosynthesis glycosyltransferase WcaL/AmsK/CpsK